MKHQNESLDEIDMLLYKYFQDNREIPKELEAKINNFKYNNNCNNKNKINLMLKKVAIIIFTFSILGSGIVFAKDIVNWIRDIFNLNVININNNSLIDAIENKDYIQNIEMDYIELNEEYSVKIDYLIIDDINLYVVFNIHSKKSIDSNYRLSVIDLKVANENCIIYDSTIEENKTEISSIPGWKNIKDDKENEERELFFLMANNIPPSKQLKFNFSKIVLYDENEPDKNKIEINGKCEITIEVVEKFINRDAYILENIKSNDEQYKITKAIATDTGLYLILESYNPEMNLKLKYNNETYNPNKRLLGINNKGCYEYILYYNITNKQLEGNMEIYFEDINGKTIK